MRPAIHTPLLFFTSLSPFPLPQRHHSNGYLSVASSGAKLPSTLSLMAANFYFFLLFLLLIVLSLLTGGSAAAVARAQDGVANPELWCVAKNNADDAALQGALGWACGPGGTNCNPVQQGGVCYFPSDIQTMASYVFNSYYLTHGLTDDSCNFGNTAALTSLNPSNGNCKFPSSSSVNNGSLSGASVTTGQGPAFQDLNGCSGITLQWYSFLTIIHLLLAVILVTEC